jgi:hypothetical protein
LLPCGVWLSPNQTSACFGPATSTGSMKPVGVCAGR